MTRINPGNHPMQRASQAHFTYRASIYFPGESDETEFFAWRRSFPVSIGHDVWIGHGAIVLPGRKIGTGAVVAAGAIVTKDVDPYTIVGGNPARLIRRRFSASVAERLQRLAWWDWSHDVLARGTPRFSGTRRSSCFSRSMRQARRVKFPHCVLHLDLAFGDQISEVDLFAQDRATRSISCRLRSRISMVLAAVFSITTATTDRACGRLQSAG